MVAVDASSPRRTPRRRTTTTTSPATRRGDDNDDTTGGLLLATWLLAAKDDDVDIIILRKALSMRMQECNNTPKSPLYIIKTLFINVVGVLLRRDVSLSLSFSLSRLSSLLFRRKRNAIRRYIFDACCVDPTTKGGGGGEKDRRGIFSFF